MPSNTWRRPASEALITAGLLLAAAVARADYREAYRKGLLAANGGDWVESARLMRAALAEHPREGEPVALDGDRQERYLPRYHLGLALFNSGDCPGARRVWDRARRNGALWRSPFARTVQKLGEECRQRQSREAAATHSARAVEADVRKAEALAGALEVLEANREVTGDEREAVVRGRREARERLAEARSRLDGGRRSSDLSELARARELTQRATDDLEKARRRAMRHLDPLAASRTAPAVTPAARVGGSSAPAALVAAVHAYFDGRYQDVVTTLADVDDEAAPAALQAHLLRAAARHALYLLGGRKDEALLRAAEADVGAVQRLDPSFSPSATAFSPRFRELFRKKG